uniref:Uncharacterized protein n=1 Tax=Pithovirus LCPAC304 TaxID=2506594 RepID=A0A481Z9Z6_9VIRU|nr:MAG: hypothetical protein LCPAC304_06320 [Pithovirus LCPAC304]
MIQPITFLARQAIFDDFVQKNAEIVFALDSSSPIMVLFENDQVGSKFTVNSLTLEAVENTIAISLLTTHTSFCTVFPHIQMTPYEQQIEDIRKMFYDKWDVKHPKDLVFLCVYPAGLDTHPLIDLPPGIKDLLGGCMEISIFNLQMSTIDHLKKKR